MNNNDAKNDALDTPKTAAQKYKTLARAVKANDASACREIYDIYTKDQGKELSDDEIFVLGLRWLSINEERDIEVAKFLKEVGFDFEQVIVTDQENERVGMPIPFKLIGDENDEKTLIDLIEGNIISADVIDGLGDTLICEALLRERFEVADKLLSLGVDINATNISGQTALHTMATKLNYRGVKWLCENGADPTIEDLQGSIASQMVPETLEDWDTDAMFDVLENYVEDFNKGKSFESTGEFSAMVERETSEAAGNSDQTLGEQADEAQAVMISVGMTPGK